MNEIVRCQVCGWEIAQSMEDAVGQTSSGAREIDPTKGTKRFWGGRWYYFDSLACRSRFEASPDEYVQRWPDEVDATILAWGYRNNFETREMDSRWNGTSISHN